MLLGICCKIYILSHLINFRYLVLLVENIVSSTSSHVTIYLVRNPAPSGDDYMPLVLNELYSE